MSISTPAKEQFVRDGYLCLEEAIDPELVERARREVTQGVDVNIKDTTEIKGRGYNRIDNIEDLNPFVTLRKKLYEYAESLVGNHLKTPPDSITIPDEMQIKVKYPEEIRLSQYHRRRPVDGHLDGYGPLFRIPDLDSAGEYTYTTIGAVVYLNTVKLGGGGFTVYPGAHWVAMEYFQDHSLESPGHQGTLPAIDDDGGWDYDNYFQRQAAFKEITGGPGTVILWHMKLLHGVGINQRNRPRIAAITRFTHERGDEIKRDAARNIWKYWDGLKEVNTDPKAQDVFQAFE